MDHECAQRGVDLLMEGLQKVNEFGGEILCGVTHSAMAKYPGPAKMENWKNSVKGLKEVAQVAQDLGIQLGLEVVNRYETNILNTASQVLLPLRMQVQIVAHRKPSCNCLNRWRLQLNSWVS